MISDLIITPLKRIENPKGDIFHALKCTEASFSGFGEAYFSSVTFQEVKGWKKHTKMVLNLVVPVGAIKFVVFDDRKDSQSYGLFFEIILSKENYCRLTIPAGIWVAFRGERRSLNLLLNVASLEHDPSEAITVPINDFNYSWDCL